MLLVGSEWKPRPTPGIAHRGVGELPAVERHALEALDVDDAADRGRVVRDERGFAADLDGLGHAGHLEGEVHVDRLSDVDDETFLVDRGEALELRGEVVGADRERAEAIDAFAVRHAISDKSCFRAFGGDRDAGDCRTLIVENPPCDVSRRLLRGRGTRERAKGKHHEDNSAHA